MLATLKAVMLAVMVTGAAGTAVVAGAVDTPLQKAIDIHKGHLGDNSTMPDQSVKGQQNSLEHLLQNQEKWMSRNVTQMPDDDANETEEPVSD